MSALRPGAGMMAVTQFVALNPDQTRYALVRHFHHDSVARAERAGLIRDHGTAQRRAFRVTEVGAAVLGAHGLDTGSYGTGTDGS